MNTSMNTLKSIGGTLLGVAIFIGIAIAIGLFFVFGASLAFIIAPYINWLAAILLILDAVILLVAIVPSARGVVGLIIYISSYVFGLATWIYGLAVTLSLWGFLAVIIGLLLGGIGVVPIGMLAAIFHGRWEIFFTLFTTLALTYGARLVGTLFVNSSEKRAENKDVIDIEAEDDDKRTWGDIA